MSNPNPQAEMRDRYEELKKKAYEDAGLIRWDTDPDEEEEWVGTQEAWQKAEKLLDEYLNQ